MKIAFSGSHGTGKTTHVLNKAHELKLQYPDKSIDILSEVVRHSHFPINKKSTKESQLWMFCNHLQKEIELCSKFDIIVTDRSLIDYCAYAYFIDPMLSQQLFDISKTMFNTYDNIYFKSIKSNDYLINDGIRDIDKQFRLDIEERMLYMYEIMLNEFDVNFIKI